MSEWFFAEKYPFQFARAADSFLKTCSPDKHVLYKTLHSRRLESVLFGDKPMGHIDFDEGDDFIFIVPHRKPLHFAALTLGWCLAHTFHYNLTHKRPQNFLASCQEGPAQYFYEEFAGEWIRKVSYATVAEFLGDPFSRLSIKQEIHRFDRLKMSSNRELVGPESRIDG